MSKIVTAADLTPKDRYLLFWASFLSLAAAGFGFAFRVAKGGDYGAEFSLTEQQVGEVFGASLWPIAITMIGFSLVVDRTGYKIPMYLAFLLQAASGIGTYFADSYAALYAFALCAGLGHGIVEAVINPICAAVYPKAKTLWLTLLHASWPAGLVVGTLIIIGTEGMTADWRIHALWIVIPAVLYAIMYLPCRFPVDERVQAGVPYKEMLQQVGFLVAGLASFLLIYEIGNQVANLTALGPPDTWFMSEAQKNDPTYVAPFIKTWFAISVIAGGVVGVVFGSLVRAIGKPLFFLLCLLMIPIATAELGTDGWIKGLMTPVLQKQQINPAFALVFSAGIMLFFRVFAGGILKLLSPPALLCISGLFSAAGLFWLGSGAAGIAIFVAFVLYALGQTYYWPCILGFVSERYPEGGALTLNTVSAIGLLSVGIIGLPILGSVFDESIHTQVTEQAPALAEAASADGSFMWMTHEKIDPGSAETFIAALPGAEQTTVQEAYDTARDDAGRDGLLFAARFPATLIVVFGLITLWFRSRGGYKPVELQHRGEEPDAAVM